MNNPNALQGDYVPGVTLASLSPFMTEAKHLRESAMLAMKRGKHFIAMELLKLAHEIDPATV